MLWNKFADGLYLDNDATFYHEIREEPTNYIMLIEHINRHFAVDMHSDCSERPRKRGPVDGLQKTRSKFIVDVEERDQDALRERPMQ